MFSIGWAQPRIIEVRTVANEKTSALIDSCATTFKRSGLLRLAEEPRAEGQLQSVALRTSEPRPSVVVPEGQGRTYSVLSGHSVSAIEQGSVFHGNAAVALREEEQEPSSELRNTIPEHSLTNDARAVGLPAVDDFLPDGGLPTGKITELTMSGGAAWGTRLALWACRAARERAALTGSDCWCAYIDPSGSLHARGVEATGVALSRLLVLRPSLEDVERVVLRLSEARVFSVIVVDLAGVPWAIRAPKSRKATQWASNAVSERRRGNKWANAEPKRQNWPRTVRQLAMRLANTSAQVILLTEGQTDVNGSSHLQQGLPLPVALRLQMSSTRAGVSLHVVKEARGRVGRQVTVPWALWWGKSEGETATGIESTQPSGREGRAKPLAVRSERVQPLLRTISPERQSREAGIATVASSRFARSSRASL